MGFSWGGEGEVRVSAPAPRVGKNLGQLKGEVAEEAAEELEGGVAGGRPGVSQALALTSVHVTSWSRLV